MHFGIDYHNIFHEKMLIFACRNKKRIYICELISLTNKQTNFSSSTLKIRMEANRLPFVFLFAFLWICRQYYFFIASSTDTATATVAPTIGLLPIPRNPIISTCAGTDDEPAN